MSNRTANNSILVIDPNTNTILSKFGTFTGTAPYFVGGVLAPNGNIYCIPGSLTSIGVITTRIPTEEPWMLAPEFNKF
jgi:DNA-binding beta-propeller fold protein YncE